jgi:hypothetical protein
MWVPMLDHLSNPLLELMLYEAVVVLRHITVGKRRILCIKMTHISDFSPEAAPSAHARFHAQPCVHCNLKSKGRLADAKTLEGQLVMCQNATEDSDLAGSPLSFG